MSEWTATAPEYGTCPVTGKSAWKVTVTDLEGEEHNHLFDTELDAEHFVAQPTRWRRINA